jgi:surfactin synthase thioesterase subunit
MTRVKLFCFPYAGGSAVVYKQWKQLLHPGIDLMPVELAGRGTRTREASYKDLEEAVEDIFRIVKYEMANVPFMLFGHSMGATIAYQLAQKIRHANMPEPLHLFFSGQSAPHLRHEDKKIYHVMPDEEFKREVLELGGTPPEFFQHPELMDMFLPLLKNDFRISETIPSSDQINPFDDDITVFLGKEDEMTHAQCDGWKNHTKQLCTIYHFKGGHFFFHDERRKIVKIINDTFKEKLHLNIRDGRVSLPH